VLREPDVPPGASVTLEAGGDVADDLLLRDIRVRVLMMDDLLDLEDEV